MCALWFYGLETGYLILRVENLDFENTMWRRGYLNFKRGGGENDEEHSGNIRFIIFVFR